MDIQINKIEAIIRYERLQEVQDALDEIGVSGLNVTEVKGCGRQKGYTEHYRGSQANISLLPKLKIESVVPAELTERAVEAIVAAAYTGETGDGLLFVLPVSEVVRIRTGERGVDTIRHRDACGVGVLSLWGWTKRVATDQTGGVEPVAIDIERNPGGRGRARRREPARPAAVRAARGRARRLRARPRRAARLPAREPLAPSRAQGDLPVRGRRQGPRGREHLRAAREGPAPARGDRARPARCRSATSGRPATTTPCPSTRRAPTSSARCWPGRRSGPTAWPSSAGPSCAICSPPAT